MTDDPALPREFGDALAGVSRFEVVTHVADDLVRATQVAASRTPALAVIEVGGEGDRTRAACAELRAVCPEIAVAGAYRADDERGANFVDGVRAGVVDFLRRPLGSADLTQLFERVAGGGRGAASDLGTVTAFLSNKGGVGKSTLAVNTAVGLAKDEPGEVLLIDASLQMGVCAAMLDVTPESTLADAARQRGRLDATLLRQLTTPHESGVDLIAAPPSAVEAGDIDDELVAQILTIGRRSYRHVVVDTFPVLDGTVVSTLDAADLAYVVVENVVPTVRGASRLVSLLRDLGHPEERRRVVLNRFTKVEGHLGVRDVEDALDCDVDHVLPFDKRLITAANLGRPVGDRSLRISPFVRAFKAIVAEAQAVRPSSGGRRLQPERHGRAEPETAEAEA